jgi:hypothetical protein
LFGHPPQAIDRAFGSEAGDGARENPDVSRDEILQLLDRYAPLAAA